MAGRRVYGSLKSPATLKVLANLFEHDLDFEFVAVDLDNGEHKNKHFLSMNNLSIFATHLPPDRNIHQVIKQLLNHFFDLCVKMGMKLYGIPASTCTTRVMACLYEKGVDFELIPVNMGAGEHKQPAFLNKNPFGQIPALEDGDLTLFESRAITAYIAEKYKDTSYDLIRHKNLKEAAQVKVWLEVESQQFNPPISAIVFQCFFAPMYGMKTDQAVVDANVEKLGKVFDVYEARLAKSKYLAGDFYSLADLHHLSFTHYLFKTPYASVFNERPRVKAWWEDISSRPVFKKISPAMSFGDK